MAHVVPLSRVLVPTSLILPINDQMETHGGVMGRRWEVHGKCPGCGLYVYHSRRSLCERFVIGYRMCWPLNLGKTKVSLCLAANYSPYPMTVTSLAFDVSLHEWLISHSGRMMWHGLPCSEEARLTRLITFGVTFARRVLMKCHSRLMSRNIS